MLSQLVYFLALLVFIISLFMILVSKHYLTKLIAIAILQNSILIFYIAIGKVKNGVSPFDRCSNLTVNSQEYFNNSCDQLIRFSSPVPHVLMLTAIVVGLAVLSVGIALIYRIHKEYGSLLEDQINKKIDLD